MTDAIQKWGATWQLPAHAWEMTHPSTCGREAWECARCGYRIEHLWGVSIARSDTTWLAYDGGHIETIPGCGEKELVRKENE